MTYALKSLHCYPIVTGKQKMKKILGLVLVISLFAGCSDVELNSDGTKILANRMFSAGEKQDFSVVTSQPMLIGFSTELEQDTRKAIQARAKASGVFEDNYSGEVLSGDGSTGIGASEGGYIEMFPENGEIKFEFRSYLPSKQSFEVYARPIENPAG